MQHYAINKANGQASLTRLESDPRLPLPLQGEVQVRMPAVSLNYRDLLILNDSGPRPNSHTRALIPASDGAGEVVAIGSGVTSIREGQRVTPGFFPDLQTGQFKASYRATALGGGQNGVLAEYITLPAQALVTIPDGLTWQEAATVPCAGVTAYNALITRGALKPGQTVLLLGTGGVSIFALQFAVAMNAKVIITSSRDEKLARAKQLGAKHLINYRTTPNWEEEVLELTAGTGVDHILEVGGAQTLERSLHCLSGGGHLAFIGGLSGFETRMDPHTLLYKNACCAGIYVGSVEDLRHTLDFMAQHAIKPVIDRVFSFDKASEAYQFLASGKHFGKVVIELG